MKIKEEIFATMIELITATDMLARYFLLSNRKNAVQIIKLQKRILRALLEQEYAK